MLKQIKEVLPRTAMLLLIFSLLCGGVYTAVITGVAQLFFPSQANGSILEVDGKAYGSLLVGQQYTHDTHMWGRIMKLDVSTFTDENGQPVLYAAPSNLSPASEEYEALVAQRVQQLQAANPDMGDTPIPVDLVTGSGSGLDPHISVAAAEYQVARLAKANQLTPEQVLDIVEKCTTGRFLTVFGEKVVNVLEVNLMLDGVLTT